MNKVTVKIEGMSCGMCEAHINEVIRKTFPKAKKVASSHKKGESTFLCENEVDMETLRDAIDETGYTFVAGTSQPYQKKGLFWF